MFPLHRREFLKSTAAASILASIPFTAHANPLGLPIACQTWPVRKMIAKDFPGTLKTLADAGFQSIELCSPVGYSDSGFAGLAKYSGAELKKILSDNGLTCVSSHFGIGELRKDQPRSIAWAKDVGLTQMIVPSLDGPKNPTLDDVKRIADEYNKMGELAAKSGIQQGLHNEGFELSKVNGKRTYDILLELLEPKFVQFQFQVSTISDGYDAAEYLTKYPGHFFSMHVQGWDLKKNTYAPVGQDSLDWKKIFSAAKTAHIKNYFVEMDLDLMKASVPYLRGLQV
jgi:sugar phosphate isomerase/epimerase